MNSKGAEMINRADGEACAGDHVTLDGKIGFLEYCYRCRTFFVVEYIRLALGLGHECNKEEQK